MRDLARNRLWLARRELRWYSRTNGGASIDVFLWCEAPCIDRGRAKQRLGHYGGVLEQGRAAVVVVETPGQWNRTWALAMALATAQYCWH